ncbi:universal stress protein [Mycobacterium sp. URHB0021]|jgi:nucleotide-binding universal stress UspA family protein
MSKPINEYGILVGVDGSPESDLAVQWAAHEAVMRKLAVTLMHVIAPVVVSWPIEYLEASYHEWQEENARDVIKQATKNLNAAADEGELPSVRTEVQHDGIATALVGSTRKAHMIVVGSRGLGPVGGALLGSVSRGLLHYARCPVAVIHARGINTLDGAAPVVLGIDGSPASESATALAFDEASRRGVDLVAIHAWSDVGLFPILGMDWHRYEEEGHALLAERLAGWQEQYPDVHVHRRIVCDGPARWLLDESRRAQLVVVGSRGRGRLSRTLLGSVSTTVAESAKSPVIVVRS